MPQDERNTERHGRKRRPGAVKRRSSTARRRSRRRGEPEREPDMDMIKSFGHRLVSFAVALLLIFIIIAVAFGSRIKTVMDSGEKFSFHSILEILYPEKYSYSTQYADMNEYFNLFSTDDIAIILQDTRIEARGKLINGGVYFSSDTVYDLFTKRFYLNTDENRLLYSTSDDIYAVTIGDDSDHYTTNAGETSLEKPAAVYDKDGKVYIWADYVKLFSNFSYEFFEDPNRMQVYTEWGTDKLAEVSEDSYVRYKGGVKSDVLTPVSAGDKVEVLESMENWTKVKTRDCFIGYLENDKLTSYADTAAEAVSGAYDPESDYMSARQEMGSVFLGFHQLGMPDNGSSIKAISINTACMNVISPTWFFLNDNEGNYLDHSSAAYVTAAHERGYKVWALLEDLTNDVDEYAIFSSSAHRQTLINNLLSSVSACGADGINLDIERIDSKTGPHYVQFIRELSIETRKAGIILSVDDFAPNEGNIYYNYKEQGLCADYICLMQYNEHWAGSEVGSVASVGFIEDGVKKAIDRGIPAEKIISILPFYTRIWRTEGNDTHSDAVGMDTAINFAAKNGLNLSWDAEACQNYGESADGTAKYRVWLEDEQSMRAKLNVLAGCGITSAGGWRIGLENADTWTWFQEILAK